MTPEHRAELIALLVLWTGYAESVFTKMTDDELLAEYQRRVGE